MNFDRTETADDLADAARDDWRIGDGESRSAWRIASTQRRPVANLTLPAADGAPLGGRVKRALDVLIASAALALSLPLLLVSALLIRLTMGAPVFFAQDRIGRNGRRFRCYKLRTMVRDAPSVLDRVLASNVEMANEWRKTQKLVRDPRVTPLGRLLRKTSIDELPQLFNVLRGEMSCIGPRPVVESELSRYGHRARHYLKTRPGLTGLWQVSGRSRTRYRRRIALDSLYVRRWSIGLDLMILLRTIPAVLRFRDSA